MVQNWYILKFDINQKKIIHFKKRQFDSKNHNLFQKRYFSMK